MGEMEVISTDEAKNVGYHDDEGRLHLPPGTPYRRARLIWNAIFRAQALPDKAKRFAALKAVPQYFSRGKGRNKPFVKRIESRQEDRSKYFPHQGEKEMARRRAGA